MADTTYKTFLTRPDWGGTAADVDIHVEEYEGLIDQGFKVESIFRSGGLTNFKSVEGQSNTYRLNRMGGVAVKGRKSGEKLDEQRIVQEKHIISVDTVAYVRTTGDYADDWTAPDYTAEYSEAHATAHAKAFDQAHVIQLIKAGAWVAPASLAASGAFSNGISLTMTGYTAEAVLPNKAAMIERKHREAVTTFVQRDLSSDLNGFVTLMRPDIFSMLMEHDKIMNVQFNGGNGNSMTGRRIGELNGMRVMETPRFPLAAIPAHFLGPAFTVSAAEAKAAFIVFHPKQALVTVEATGMNVRMWDDKKEFTNVLDSYNMYNIGIRRGDATAVVFTD